MGILRGFWGYLTPKTPNFGVWIKKVDNMRLAIFWVFSGFWGFLGGQKPQNPENTPLTPPKTPKMGVFGGVYIYISVFFGGFLSKKYRPNVPFIRPRFWGVRGPPGALGPPIPPLRPQNPPTYGLGSSQTRDYLVEDTTKFT